MPFSYQLELQEEKLHSVLFTAVSPALDKTLARAGLPLIMHGMNFQTIRQNRGMLHFDQFTQITPNYTIRKPP